MLCEDADDFDALNDETFGEAAGNDEDWEQQHEKLVSLSFEPSNHNKKMVDCSTLEREMLNLSTSVDSIWSNSGLPGMTPPFLPGPIFNHFLQVQQRFPHQQRQYYHRSGGRHHQERNSHGDEYANLMTKSNKEWLIKVLCSALNFSDPFKEDFYFTTLKSRQLAAAAKAKKGNEQSMVPALIIPERKADESSKYEPVQFEGSLGKIQVSNVKCPRKLLDFNVKQSNKEVDPSRDRPLPPIGRIELNAFRKLLLDIEKLYVIMLEIDEEDKKMGALPETQHKPHVDRRTELCNNLFKCVYDDRTENINQRIASIKKGVALIVRSLQVLSDANQKAAIVRSLLDVNNSHFVTNYRDKGLHRLDFKEILMETLAQLRESKIPDIDKLTNKLNRLLFKIIDPSCFKLL